MNIKYFLRGLGVGIVFTTLILAFSTKKDPVVEMTDAQIVARAKTLGMMSVEEYDKKLDESLDELETKTSEVPLTEPSESPSVNPSVSPSIEPEELDPKPSEKPITDESQIPTKTYYSVEIQRGWFSNQVAEYLQNIGIIEDAKKFDKYLSDNGMTTKIKAGNYDIPKDAGYYEIAIIITSK